MPRDISQEEKQHLFTGFINIISDPENNPEEFRQAGDWIADPRNTVSVSKFEAQAGVGEVTEPYYSLLKEYHDDWVEEMPESEVEAYRLKQMGHIALSNN